MTAGSPLAGKRVVNTRALHQAGELDRLLEDHGAIPVSFPCIAIRPPADVEMLDAAIGDLVEGRFDWVVFTSVNTVEAVAGRLNVLASIEPVGRRTREPVKGSPTHTSGPPHLESLRYRSESVPCHPERSEGSRRSPSTKVAVVGSATAAAVTRLLGWPVAFVPDIETATDLGRTLSIAPGGRVLLPKSAIAGPALAAILSGRGAMVIEVVAYEMTTGAGGVDLASSLAAGEVDAICFTSGSTVRGCLERLAGAPLPDAVRVACIGSETARVARDVGLPVDVVPDRPTAHALVEALAASFTDH